jgi:hypothetical protein
LTEIEKLEARILSLPPADRARLLDWLLQRDDAD